MQDLFISINNNVAKISCLDKDGIKFHTQLLTESAAKDTKILDSFAFAQLLEGLINQVTLTPRSKLRLNFVVSPEDTYSRFITINKRDGIIDDQIIADIKDKLDGESLDDLYFSYQKIAPFVYQFVGVKKEFLEKYIEVAGYLKMTLHSVIPWVMLLPKYVGTNDSAIFITSVDDNQVVALSELGGIFFTGVFKKQKSTEELKAIIQELSVYKRSKPIQKIYTLNYPLLTLSEGYSIHEIDLPDSNTVEGVLFESNLLTNYMIDLDLSMASTQLNLLNLLPITQAPKKKSVLAMLLIPLVVLAVAGALVGGYMFFTKTNLSSLLAGKNTAVVPTPQTPTDVEVSESSPATPVVVPDLKRENLSIRIENGSNIAGIAAKTKDLLGGKNYKITDIATSDTNRDSTLFRFKKGKVDYKTLVSADTKDVFPQIVIEDTLPDTSTYDLLIIVGSTVKF